MQDLQMGPNSLDCTEKSAKTTAMMTGKWRVVGQTHDSDPFTL